MIRVGQVQSAFGLDGAVKVVSLTDFPERFRPGSQVRLSGVERRVEWSKPHGEYYVVKFEGMADRTTAELHRGTYLEVPDEEAHALPPGRFYPRDIVGLAVMTRSGRKSGSIVEVMNRPANDVWVADLDGTEHLIPATSNAIVEVDVERRVVVIEDWVLDSEEA